jgi:hypothetical protein
MSLASTEYPKGVNEFVKSGLTPVDSVKVRPPRVAESPASFECKVLRVIETGDEGAAGNLVICEVVLAHIKDEILDEGGLVDQKKLDAVARMGGDWYCRANGAALFQVPKPLQNLGIGVDQIPLQIRNSHYLTGNDLGLLGNVTSFPDSESVQAFADDPSVKSLIQQGEKAVHEKAHELLSQGKIVDAWKLLLVSV